MRHLGVRVVAQRGVPPTSTVIGTRHSGRGARHLALGEMYRRIYGGGGEDEEQWLQTVRVEQMCGRLSLRIKLVTRLRRVLGSDVDGWRRLEVGGCGMASTGGG